MQSTTSGNKSPTHTNAPAVPISVYRELATELETVEAKLDSITAHNQQLAEENQQLRYDLKTAVNSVLYLQQVVNASNVGTRTYTYYPTNEQPKSNREVKQTTPRSSSTAVQAKVKSPSFIISEPNSGAKTEFTEQEQHKYRRHNEVAPEVGSWRLAIAIMLIMITAFGAGYFIVRPLLPSR